MTTLAPYNWLKRLPAELLKLNDIPLFGYPPQFDEEAFRSSLSTLLGLEDLKLTFQPIKATEKERLKEGFSSYGVYSFQVSPFEGGVTLLLPGGKEGALPDALQAELLSSTLPSVSAEEALEAPQEPGLLKAFTDFVLIEAMFALQQAFSDKALSLRLLSEEEVGEDPFQSDAWTLDCDLSWKGGSLPCRLILSPLFRESWKERYKEKSMTLPSRLMQEVSIDVHLEAGRVELSREEWKSLNPGDFVVLDSCHLVAGKDKGRVLLTLNGIPFFRAKVKDGALKILEYPLFYETGSSLTQNFPKEIVDETMQNDEWNEEEDSFDEDEFAEEGESLEEAREEEVEEESENEPHQQTVEAQKTEAQPVKIEDLPLNVVVEVGRFRMNLQKLSELQPGNMISLDIHPDQGVDLVVNGTCIAKGELLQLGENLGVRILDIAK